MFCVECGKKVDRLYNGLCLDCYLKKKRFFVFPNEIVVQVCRNCGAYKVDDEWEHGELNEIVEEYIKKNIKKELDCEFEIDFEKRIARCIANFEGRKIIEEGGFRLRIKKVLCEKCSLMKGGYFEAILQIRKRNLGRKMEREIEDVINRRVKEAKSFIMKKEKMEEGIDYYIGNKKVAHSIAKELKELLKAEFKMSSSLVGMKDGVEIYRDTYLIRLPEYNVGSFIKLNDIVYRVEGIGKKIELVSLSGERRYVYKNEMKKAKILELKEREAMVIHQDRKGIYIMDPETYETYFIKSIEKPGKRIKIVEYDGKIYVMK